MIQFGLRTNEGRGNGFFSKKARNFFLFHFRRPGQQNMAIKLVFIAVLLSAAVASTLPVDTGFDVWAAHFGKSYANVVQRTAAEAAFDSNRARVISQNAAGTARFELNEFADMEREAFSRARVMPAAPAPIHPVHRYLRPGVAPELPTSLPASFDWRDKGAVTPVRDQGSIGSCWAFSTVQNVEGVHFLAGNQLTPLSAEQLVDCDGSTDPAQHHADCGPFGGWPYLAFQYIVRAGGLDSDADVPYCAGDGSCFPCPAPGYNTTLCGPPVPSCDKVCVNLVFRQTSFITLNF
jgi:cathepsin F